MNNSNVGVFFGMKIVKDIAKMFHIYINVHKKTNIKNFMAFHLTEKFVVKVPIGSGNV